jgi:hypothetical protein
LRLAFRALEVLRDLLQVETKPPLGASQAHAAEGSRVSVNPVAIYAELGGDGSSVYKPHAPGCGLAAVE